MNVSNPETKEENKTEQKEVETDIAMEKARELQEGKIEFKDIKDENLLKEIHERFMIKEEEIPEVQKETKEETKAEVENPEIPKTEEGPSQEELQDRKKNLDELNTIKQKIASSNKELERIRKLNTEKTRTKIDDPLSEEAITNINNRLNQVEDREQTFYEEKTTEAEEGARELQQQRLLLDLQIFQGDSGLKMSKSIKIIDAQYKDFLKDVGGLENANQYFNNETYRETKAKEGIKFKISDKDFKKYQTIVQVQQFKKEGNYPTFSSAFADYSVENGLVQDEIKQAVIKATEETVELMTNPQNTATTLSPDDGGGSASSPGDMSREQMANILMNMPSNPSPAQERQQKAIHEKLFPKD